MMPGDEHAKGDILSLTPPESAGAAVVWDRLRVDQRHATMFPPSFFSRGDETDDSEFYAFDRLVTHIDDGAIAAVGELYNKLGLCGPSSGPVLDICSSWISHFPTKPERLVITGMNETELTANEMADEWLVKDINADPTLPFADASFTAVTCCVSVDYLHKPLDVFAEVRANSATRWRVRLHVFEPLLPDESDPWLVGN